MSTRRGRRSRRDRHHEASHSGAQTPPPPIADHPAVPGDSTAFVTSATELEEVVRHIREAGAFAYDTEFIGEETYVPHLCLVQLATRERLFLIDPIEIDDLEPLWAMIADPELETLVHAGDQDLEPVQRCIGRCPANIIDTQIAAGFVGQSYPLSLARTVDVMTGYQVTKGMTFTKWDDRPLSDMQKRYAADDVRYLPLVWERMKALLESNGHLDKCLEECQRGCRPGAFDINLANVCRKFHRRNPLRRNQWYRLCSLVLLRDRLARAANVPPRTLIPDGSLSDLARRRIDSVDAMASIKGLPRPTIQRYGQDLLSSLEDGHPEESLPELPPKLREESATDRIRIDSIWTALSCWCLAQQIAPSLVSTRSELAEWILSGASEQGSRSLWTPGWRLDFAGGFLDPFLNGDVELSMEWKEDRLRPVPHGHGG